MPVLCRQEAGFHPAENFTECLSVDVSDSALYVAAILARRQNVVSHRGCCHQCANADSQVSEPFQALLHAIPLTRPMYQV